MYYIGIKQLTCCAISQVIELPVKHPELFDALGIDQPKVGAVEANGIIVYKLLSYDCILLLKKYKVM